MNSLFIVLPILGLMLALAGSYIASTLPFIKISKLAGGWGSGTEEEWERIQSIFRRKAFLGNALLITGTFLQVLGAMLASNS